jgi:uncharacterized protein YgiM (DUF1202 family)
VLYDYTARTDVEISVNAGGAVNVLETDDGSGWVRVELNGQEGLIPAAYIKVEFEGDGEADEYVQALYDYTARNHLELSLYAGAIVLVTSKDCSEGWWEGHLDGHVGQFPVSYVVAYQGDT